MARHPRNSRQCESCGWMGITARGKVRQTIGVVTWLGVLILVGLELLGVIRLGDQVWVIALTVMILSVALRMLIAGDRCPNCEGTVVPVR